MACIIEALFLPLQHNLFDMVKISGMNGVIRDDAESGQPLVASTPSSSSTGATTNGGSTTMASYTNALTEETQLYGTKIKNWYILMFCGVISMLLGFKGFILAVLILGIGYYVIGAPNASTANGSSSSGGGGGGPRPRSNIRGLGDYPKPPPKSC